jgi:hypothetical protein
VGIVEEYWSGVVQRLQAEVDVFARLVKHRGEQGRENELALARVFEALLPQRLGIGSGLLLDAQDRYSRQTDLVVFEAANDPAILAQTTQLLFPIESVLACVEIKTRLTPNDVSNDFVAKMQALQELTSSRAHVDGTARPLFALFAYELSMQGSTLVQRLRNLEAAQRPDLLCIVRHGVIGGASSLLTVDVMGMEPDNAECSGVDADYELVQTLVTDEEGSVHVLPDAPGDIVEIGGRTHNVVPHGDGLAGADAARALLIFADALLKAVAAKQGLPAPTLSAYLTGDVRSAWSLVAGAG